MEEFFYQSLEQCLGRELADAAELFLFHDLVAHLDSELSIRSFWALLDWLSRAGMKRQAEAFATTLARMVAARVTRLPVEWDAVRRDYADYLEIKKRPEKSWVKWSLKSSERYYQLCSQLSLEILHHIPIITVLGGEMSGDMFGIGATMILKPSMITVVKKAVGSPFDHTSQIEAFLTACVQEPSRVVVHEKQDRGITWNELLQAGRFRALFTSLAPTPVTKARVPDEIRLLPLLASIMMQTGKIHWVTSLDTGTKFLKERTLWEVQTPRIKIRHRWGVISHDFLVRARALENWLRSRGLPVDALRSAHEHGREKKVLILWSRFTGKKGEIHVEHDTSFKGTQQIALQALRIGAVDHVIITGDTPVVHDKLNLKPQQSLDEAKRARRTKFTRLCDDINAARGTQCAFDLTGFWEDPTSKPWTGGARIGQFLLFEYLHRVCDARHLGMRSGNLEALALLGYWVRYMEETQSWGGERMEQWHDRGLGYTRIVLSAPPTRTGKYLIARVPKGTVFAPPKDIKWLLERRDLPTSNSDWWSEEKPLEISRGGLVERKVKGSNQPETVEVDPFARGFSPSDLLLIMAQLQRKNLRPRIDKMLPGSCG